MAGKSNRGVLLVIGVFIVGLTAMSGMFLARWLLPPPPKLPPVDSTTLPSTDPQSATRPTTTPATNPTTLGVTP